MAALLLAILALQEPHFVMNAEAGDRLRVELFELEGGVASPHAQALLPSTPIDMAMTLDNGTPLTVLAASGAVDRRSVLLIGRAAVSEGREKVCRLSETGGASDNLPRAWSWCASFLDQPTATVELPALTPPSR